MVEEHAASKAVLAARFMLVSCFTCSSTFNKLHGIISQKI
jgi:hypothetical protein